MIIEQGTDAEAIVIKIPLVFSKVDYQAKDWSATFEAMLREMTSLYREQMLAEITEAGWSRE